MPPNDKERRELVRALSFLSQIAFLIIGCVAAGVFLGNFLDNFFGTSPWLLLLFSLLGVAAAFKSIYDLAKKG